MGITQVNSNVNKNNGKVGSVSSPAKREASKWPVDNTSPVTRVGSHVGSNPPRSKIAHTQSGQTKIPTT